MKKVIISIYKVLNKKQRVESLGVFALILVGAALETLGVSAIIPLVTVLLDEKNVYNNQIIDGVCDWLNVGNAGDRIIFLMVCIILVFVVKNLYMFFLNYVQYAFTYRNQYRLTMQLMDEYMHRPYEFFLNNNYNLIRRIVVIDPSNVFSLISNVLKLATEVIIFVSLIMYLVFKDCEMAILVVLLGLTIMVVLTVVYKPYMKKAGEVSKDTAFYSDKWFYQGFNGIKEVKITGTETKFINKYGHYYWQYLESQRFHMTANTVPALIVETLFVGTLISYFIFQMLQGEDLISKMPIYTAFAVAAIRLMPSINRINAYLNSISYLKTYLVDIETLSDNTEAQFIDNAYKYEKIRVKKAIELKDIWFKYFNSNEYIFENMSMTIPAGKATAIIGKSGAGKSTVVDIIMGLLIQEKGKIYVDGRDINAEPNNWMRSIGYIPQVIYLMDDSIRNNICLAAEESSEVDDEYIWSLLKKTQLYDFVKSLPEQLNTVVGDRGARLSGGQRQRLGIARALFTDPDILIFDEATSALDGETERAILQSIEVLKKEKTLIIVAHRLNTIKSCDVKYRVENKKITRVE